MWFVACIYKYIITEVQRVILVGSMFPELREDVMLEDLKKIDLYYSSNGTECGEDVKAISEAICTCLGAGKSSPFKSLIKRILSVRSHKSLLPAFMLIVMCNFEDSKVEGVAPFELGWYWGNTQTPTKTNDTTWRDRGVLHKANVVGEIVESDLATIDYVEDVALRDTHEDENDAAVYSPVSPQLLGQMCFKHYNRNIDVSITKLIENRKEIVEAFQKQQKRLNRPLTYKIDLETHKPQQRPDQCSKPRGGKASATKKTATASLNSEIDDVQTPKTTQKTPARGSSARKKKTRPPPTALMDVTGGNNVTQSNNL